MIWLFLAFLVNEIFLLIENELDMENEIIFIHFSSPEIILFQKRAMESLDTLLTQEAAHIGDGGRKMDG